MDLKWCEANCAAAKEKDLSAFQITTLAPMCLRGEALPLLIREMTDILGLEKNATLVF